MFPTVPILLWMTNFILQQSSAEENCLNRTGQGTSCCADYYILEGKCVPCSSGKFGPNCMFTCEYPKYGRRCLGGICQCSPEFCDPSRGCTGQETRTSEVFSTLSTKNHSTTSTSESTLGTTNVTSATKLDPDHSKNASRPGNSVVISISVIGVIVVGLLVAVIGFQLRERVRLRFDKPSKRASAVASQRHIHVDTYCEIDNNEVLGDGDNPTETEPEVYEFIDQSKKDPEKYTALPSGKRVSKNRSTCTPSTYSMQKILECDEEDKGKELEVQMRRDKSQSTIAQKRLGKTSTQVSGYIDMDKKTKEDYVSMDAQSLVSAISVSDEKTCQNI